MNRPIDQWRGTHSIETTASPEVIWRFFCDVPGWKTWNAGIERIEIKGLFEVGTEFVMTPPGQGPLLSLLIEVRENECFVDETRVGDLVVVVAHRIENIDSLHTRITYDIEATGPDCAEIGAAISSDFPDVLKSLVQLVELQS